MGRSASWSSHRLCGQWPQNALSRIGLWYFDRLCVQLHEVTSYQASDSAPSVWRSNPLPADWKGEGARGTIASALLWIQAPRPNWTVVAPYRLTRMDLPETKASTSFRVTMVVSPGVVTRRAPCAHPYLTASSSDMPMRRA